MIQTDISKSFQKRLRHHMGAGILIIEGPFLTLLRLFFQISLDFSIATDYLKGL